jgi:TRAP-type C4-dicarboxylate transport system substrate-binding protein
MKTALPAILLILAILTTAAGAASAAGQVVNLGTLAPEGSAWHNVLRDMAEDWKKATGGKVRFRIYAGGVAGDEPFMVRKMRNRQLHAAALTGVGLAEIAPEVMALQLPRLIQSYEELDYVLARMAPELEAILKDKGYTVLHWGDAGWVTFFAQRPVVTVDDLRKVKLFVWASSTGEVEVWKDAGVIAVPLEATEIHPGLQTGLINAFSTTPLAALSFQWFGAAKHMTGMRWAPLIGATVIRNDAWEKIPADLKPALLQTARDTGERLKKETRKLGDEAVEIMRQHGLVVHPVPAEALAEWERQARAAYPRIMGRTVPAKMRADVERLVAEFRAKKQTP